MNLLELVDKKDLKIKELESFTEKLKVEHRKMDESENTDFNKIKEDIKNLEKQIEDIQAEDKMAVRNDDSIKKNNVKKMNDFSLLKTIRSIVENRGFDERTLEILEQGKKDFTHAGMTYRGQITLPVELRADTVLAGTQYAGQEAVAEAKFPLLPALRAKTVLGQAGATFYTGLVGDVSIPVIGGSSVFWGTETGAAISGTTSFTEVTLTPKRLTSYIDISKQFLVQDSINAEQALMQDLTNAILATVEATVFDATASSTSRPAGLFYNADYSGTLSGTTTWAKLIGIKAAVDTANALTGNLAYVTTPALGAVWETTTIDSGGGVMCMNNGKVGGYPVYITSNVNSGKVAFGNWADYVVGQWGGMDITVDPYSQAVNGKVRIIVNTFWDFKTRRSASFKLSQLS